VRIHPAGPRSGELAHEGQHHGPPADLDELTPAVWPQGVERAAEGHLTVRGHDVRDLVAEHGSPVFLLDEADLRQRCRDYRDAFGGASVFYAAKAFLCTAVARYLEELAGTYHRFYDSCRVLPRGDEEITPLTTARLWACAATATVLRNGLAVLGVHAPERM